MMHNQVLVQHDPFAGHAISKVLPLTQAQKEIWLACKFGGQDANRAYNESVSLILKGSLDPKRLDLAIQKLVGRHESLRATFSANGQFMTVFETVDLAFVQQDISDLEATAQQAHINTYLNQEANHSFNLTKGPLAKFGLIQLGGNTHHLIITAHHIICDGWSLGIILEELGALYANGNHHALSTAATYASYVQEELDFLPSADFTKTEAYWIGQFKNNVPTVDLPIDFPRPAMRTYQSQRLDFPLDNALVAQIKKVGVQSGASLVVTLMAAFEVLLYHLTGKNDIVLGLPAAGQSASGKLQLVGHCVNLLPIRGQANLKTSFNDYLKQRKTAVFDAYDHQKFSFGQLLQKLAIPRDPGRVPLVPVMFNIDMGMDSAVTFDGLEFELKSNPRNFEAFEIFMNATGTEKALVLEWSYNKALFKETTITQMMAAYQKIIEKVIADPTIAIGQILETDPTDYLQLNDTAVSYPDRPLHELLSLQAQQTPEAKAITLGDHSITYLQFEEFSNQLAHYLKAQGVKQGDFVAVCLNRSIDLVVTLVGILKAGAAYLPLDANYPEERLKFMLTDAGAAFLIVNQQQALDLPITGQTLVLERLPLQEQPKTPLNITVPPTSRAYILYTSGSTGKPKGVTITHKNLVNFLYSMIKEPGLKPTDKLLSVTTISFDIAGLELYTPLLIGAQLILTNEETAKDSRLLLELLKAAEITVMQATPTTWQMLLETGWEEALPLKALAGGEALPLTLSKKLLDRVDALWNMYGPTETTIWSSVQQIHPQDAIITVGKPIDNTQMYIIDPENNLVKAGSIGELCIAGDGVAEGYYNRPELTAEKFIVNPFGEPKDAVLYKTGDLAKLLPNGQIQCLGRIDQQVKIRGHRIELGEIEDALDSLDGVQSAVVLLDNDYLIGCIITSENAPLSKTQTDQWKATLKKELPPHMVPFTFKTFTVFPTTLNGKIDRKAMMAQLASNDKAEAFKGPSTPSEKIVAKIWQECLKMEAIAVTSDFFELGGHSLIAVRVMSMIEKQTGIRLPLPAMLEYPTIAQLASLLDDKDKKVSGNSLVLLKDGTHNKPPLFLVHGGNYNVLLFKSFVNHMHADQAVYALQARGINGIDEPHNSIEQMAAHYIKELTTVDPHGPYNIGGYSFGGIIAYEMAKQLIANGKKVNSILPLDSYVFPHYYHQDAIKKEKVYRDYQRKNMFFHFKTMISSPKGFARRLSITAKRAKDLGQKLILGKKKQHQMDNNRPLKLDQMHMDAFLNYHISPMPVSVDLLKVETDEVYYAHDTAYFGWKEVALNGVNRHMIPGNHDTMFKSPNDAVLGQMVQQILDHKNA